MNTKNIIVAIVIIALAFIGGSYLIKKAPVVVEQPVQHPVYVFSSENGETLSVVFDNTARTAQVTGASFDNALFVETISASGARYENGDFILWNKGNEITLYQLDTVLFTGVLKEEENTRSQYSIVGSWLWKKTQMNNDDRIIPLQQNAFVLTFNEDGSVSGTTDCNRIMGSYTMTEYGISFSPFASTRMFCENSQEEEFTTMIANSTGFIFDEKGNLILLLKYDSGSILFEKQ